MVSFIILLGATLIIFIIFEQVLLPQSNCQSLLSSKEKGKTEKRICQGVMRKVSSSSSCSDRAGRSHASPPHLLWRHAALLPRDDKEDPDATTLPSLSSLFHLLPLLSPSSAFSPP